MIDLKNEIEGLKNNINTEDYKYNMGCIVVKELENETIDKVLQLLDQYNIITAPKTIKLSEIVSKIDIQNSFYINHKISIIRDNNDIDIWEDYDIEFDETILSQSNLLVVINENKIKEINVSDRHEELNKWLYTLWIAGTIIEDDLKEE